MRSRATRRFAYLLAAGGIVAAGCSDSPEPEVLRQVTWMAQSGGGGQVFDIWWTRDGDSIGALWNQVFDADGNLEHAAEIHPRDGGRSYDGNECREEPPPVDPPGTDWDASLQVNTADLLEDGYRPQHQAPGLPAPPPSQPQPDPRALRSVAPDADRAVTWVSTQEGPRGGTISRQIVVDARGYPAAVVIGSSAAGHEGAAQASVLILFETFTREDGEAAVAERFRWDEWCG